MGIFLWRMSGNQVWLHRFNLKAAVKAPMQDTKELASSTSPIIDKMLFFNFDTFSPHLLFSPERPFTRVSAELNLARHMLASASTFAFLASASSKDFLSTFTFSLSTLTFSLMTANWFYLISSSQVAASHISYKGLTSLKILLNSMILTNQEHKYLAASF